ncbi:MULTISPECIES: NIPSNAP family protein [Burkholderia cepacia complex]|uniref:NIPSNAP family protein n=1 Tax=Burkholderia latens TaxID=488446 RepID=A0A6H9T2K3_9BURK|nr:MULTISPECIES: NIPSNAP family protein [Burkholderia cepacia complex]KAB0643006.1 NIPSNAP family protein [Burkholderia latens]KVH77750.1 NIPSNAP domain containing protein [Burkholderia cepacia]KWC69149.1 NIPSNAP domain containing protein [Burkholderia cepacia]MBY4713151.1 NIPSNAP family protein [Burkholderia cepacia]MBY4735548.1 NIPSNAP family protein [Burkholderia cepacia]
MYYEMRTYTVQIGKMNEYLRHFEKEGLPVISRYATLVGWWYTEIGELNQVVHIWAYESLDDRIKRRTALYEDPDWLEKFVPKAFPMLEKMESKLLRPAVFSPIR